MKYRVHEICRRIAEIRADTCGARGRGEFAKRIGISVSSYSYYEKARTPPAEILVKIAEITGVTLEWLLTGRGPKHSQSVDQAQRKGIHRRVALLLVARPQLAEPLASFLDLLEGIAAFPEKLPEPSVPLIGSSWQTSALIPVIGRTAAGVAHFWSQLEADFDAEKFDRKIEQLLFSGKPAAQQSATIDSASARLPIPSQCALVQMSTPDEQGLIEFLACAALKQNYPDAVAWRIDGDSMSPRFVTGDLVIGSASVPAQEGLPCIARLRDQIGVTCKLYHRRGEMTVLQPVNPRYQSLRVSPYRLEWAVAVLASVRPSGATQA